MFWKSNLEIAQKEEIEFLRSEVKELRIQLIAMSDKSPQYWNAKLAEQKTSKPLKTPDSVVEEIMSKEPKTEEDKKKQADAIKYSRQVFGGY